jgi:hypothetical protein
MPWTTFNVRPPETLFHEPRFNAAIDLDPLAELVEEGSTVGVADPSWAGWKKLIAWTGAILVSWILVYGCLVIARGLLA